MTALYPSETTTLADPKPTQTELWQRYHTDSHGSAVEEEIVKKYLSLVKTVVGRLAMTLPSHVDSEDLYSAGLTGLLNAIRNYDPQSGTPFENYARVRIRGSVFDELRRLDWVPRSIHSKARKVQAAMQEVEQAKGRAPTDSEVAKVLKITVQEYQQWLNEIRPATFICLDSVQHGEERDGPSEYEGIADLRQERPDVSAHRREMAQLIAERLEELPEIQRKVLALYYFEDLRLREIAEAFGLTESRICQIHAQAILSIKSFLQKRDAVPM